VAAERLLTQRPHWLSRGHRVCSTAIGSVLEPERWYMLHQPVLIGMMGLGWVMGRTA
jgi:hypothetical protein